MKILQKTGCHRDRKFRKVTFENQGISGNSKKRGALNRFRFWITLISVIMSVCLFLFIILISLNPPIWFSKLDSEFQIPLILSLGASSVFLMAILLRGVYRTRSDRNDILPDHLKQLLDVVNKQDK